jgi:hypothetical protein
MEKEKQDFKEPEVTTYERDELIMDKVITGLANNSDR